MFYDDAPESDAHGAPEDPLSARLRRFLPRVTDRVKALRDRFRSVDGTAADGLGASDREYV